MAEDRYAAAMNEYYQRGEEADRLDTASAGQQVPATLATGRRFRGRLAGG